MMLKKLALLAVMAVLALPSPSQAANEKIKILSGPTSGAWYVGMGAVAKAINKQFPEIDVNLLPGGGLSNPGRLSKKEGELSIGTHSIMVSAAKGIERASCTISYNAPMMSSELRSLIFIFLLGVYSFSLFFPENRE